MSEPMSVAAAARALRDGGTTSVALVSAAIERADRYGDRLGTFASRRDEEALREAEHADAELAAGTDRGPLHGIPLGVSELVGSAMTYPARPGNSRDRAGVSPGGTAPPHGAVTAAASGSRTKGRARNPQRTIGPAVPSRAEAVAVTRLRAAGAITLGATTAMEFTIGLPDPHRTPSVPRNPWNPATWAGGASSGSANGIAAGMFPAAVGADAAGGLRMAAAFCGVVGLRPTHGRVPNPAGATGVRSSAPVGPMARTVEDCALMLSLMAGYDGSDDESADRAVPDYAALLNGDLDGVRIGVDPLTRIGGDLADRSLSLRLGSALDVLAAAGAVIVDIELPWVRELYAADMLTLVAEALARHSPEPSAWWDEFDTAGHAAFATGAFYTAADYVRAQSVLRGGRQAVRRVLADVDLVVTPTAAVGAPRVDTLDSPGFMAVFGSAVHTPYWSAMGNPTLSVPIGFGDDGMPLGMQISGRPFDEATVLRAGDAYQRRAEWHTQVPDMRGKLSRLPAFA